MLTAYLIVIAAMSVITLVVFASDKISAMQAGGRVPEIVLITLAALGGATGAFFGTIIFHHKSNFGRKFYIQISIWVSLAIQVGLLLLGLFTGGKA